MLLKWNSGRINVTSRGVCSSTTRSATFGELREMLWSQSSAFVKLSQSTRRTAKWFWIWRGFCSIRGTWRMQFIWRESELDGIILRIGQILIIFFPSRSLEVHSSDRSAWRQYFTLGEIFKKYGNIQESILHLRHALELSPQHDKILQALEEIEKIPISSSLNFYTILIILLLVLLVLIFLRYLNQDEGSDTEPKREKIRCFKFRGAMSKVRVIRKK